MMRLPVLEHHRPSSLDEALSLVADGARFLAGGTDLLPKLKRRQYDASALISLGAVPELSVFEQHDGGWTIGAGVRLVDLARSDALRASHPALWQAAVQVASPVIRSTATLGGNLCVDTRCFWWDQTAPWRQAAGSCMKRDRDVVCRVAPNSPRCWAVSSTDTAPALGVLGATVRLLSSDGERRIPLADLYADDGIDYVTLRPGEILVDVHVPATTGRSAFWKIRRRQSIDFALLSAAVSVTLDDGVVTEASVGLGAVGSCPLFPEDAADLLVGTRLEDEAIEAAAKAAAKQSRPMETSDLPSSWRRRVLPVAVRHALREVRGDDVTRARERYGLQVLTQPG